MVSTGLRLVIGSWKIMAISRPRIPRSAAVGEVEEVAALEDRVPVGILPARGQDAEDRERSHALPAARLADDPERLAAARCRTRSR